MQLDLASGIAAQASAFGTALPGQRDPHSHYTIYAIDEDVDLPGARLFALQRFEIHPVVDLASPCFIDAGPHVPYPGLHVSQYANAVAAATGITDIANPPASASEADQIAMATALQRMANVAALGAETGVRVVSSASTSDYPAVAPDCTGPDDQIPPPSCTLPDANARRLRLCQAAWAADPTYFEGSDRVLVEPLGGIAYGMVDGQNPVNQAPVGGAQFFVDEALRGIDAFAIYAELDAAADPGELVLFGRPTQPTRGVVHVHLTSVTSGLTAELAIFANLDEDEVTF
ncbi:MAG: hypothetical protein NT062_39535 [Proteobacteria bacterium]|nr:hypothetical protein [Pseudomonadota bacterium]